MGEDMTYTTEPTRAQLAARVRELEARLAVLEPSGFALANSALIQRVHQLEAQNADLLAAAVTNAQDMLALRVECDGMRARWAAVPVEAIVALYFGLPYAKCSAEHMSTVDDWLTDVCPGEMGPEMEPQ